VQGGAETEGIGNQGAGREVHGLQGQTALDHQRAAQVSKGFPFRVNALYI